MTAHKIAESSANLTDLIDRAITGEAIVMARDGKPVAELKLLKPQREPRRVIAEDNAWLDANRVGAIMPREEGGNFVSRMRDEEWDRFDHVSGIVIKR